LATTTQKAVTEWKKGQVLRLRLFLPSFTGVRGRGILRTSH
jgi:hypothetical protein